MTVCEVRPEGMVEVVFQHGGAPKREVYPAAVLRKKQPPQAPRVRYATFKKGF